MLLAIDTTQGACSAAIADSDGHLGGEWAAMSRGHAEALPPMLARLMSEYGVAPAAIDRIAVTIGPGTFSGIRVGLAAARALALANRLAERRCLIAGFTSLEAIAAGVSRRRPEGSGPLLVATDARQGQAYWQRFELGPQAAGTLPLAMIGSARRDMIADLAAESGATPGLVAGTAAPALAEMAKALAVVDGIDWPDARDLLDLARQCPDRFSPTPPGPLYLREPDAKKPGPPRFSTGGEG